MAIYSVGRRRIIFAILATCVLLLALDRSGNPVVDRLRDGASIVIRPVDIAVDVIATPVARAWRSYAEFDDIERENEALREENDRLRGTQAAAEASIRDYQELLALTELPSLAGIETEVAQVVGRSATNLDEIVEINKGSLSGIAVGMPVVNQAGLIGRVTSVAPTTARVRLITDRDYSVSVEILVGSADDEDTPVVTTPSGLTPDEVEDLTTTDHHDHGRRTRRRGDGWRSGGRRDPGRRTRHRGAGDRIDVAGDACARPRPRRHRRGRRRRRCHHGHRRRRDHGCGDRCARGDGSDGSRSADRHRAARGDGPDTGLPIPVDTAPSTTVPPLAEKEFGLLFGNGRGRVPQVRFVQDNPSLAVLGIGDLVVTAGGSTSLSPPGIPIGRVINRVDRPGVGGPLLEVELEADVTRLNFVQVVIFRPLTEVGG